MAQITLRETSLETIGELPKVGIQAPNFTLVDTSLEEKSLSDYAGHAIVLNIFPSLDTDTCAASVRRFNIMASQYAETTVLCISRDLPFAQKRFCGAEGLDYVVPLSDFNSGSFGKDYGVEIVGGKFNGLHARAVLVLDKAGKIIYTELVKELSDEPDYDHALEKLRDGI